MGLRWRENILDISAATYAGVIYNNVWAAQPKSEVFTRSMTWDIYVEGEELMLLGDIVSPTDICFSAFD